MGLLGREGKESPAVDAISAQDRLSSGDADGWPGMGGESSSDGVDCERDERGAQGIGSER